MATLPPQRVVAFFDILGFADLIKKMPADLYLIDALHNSLALIDGIKQWKGRKSQSGKSLLPEGLEVSQFSDSVVVSCDVKKGTAWALKQVIMYSSIFSVSLLDSGILVRGGIAKGWMRHEDNELFGQGMLDAYYLESQVARNPRIVLADELAGIALMTGTGKAYLRQDSDGFYFVNPYDPLIIGFLSKPGAFSSIGIQLHNALLNAIPRPDVLSKIRWSARLFNQLLKENPDQEEYKGAKPIPLHEAEECVPYEEVMDLRARALGDVLAAASPPQAVPVTPPEAGTAPGEQPPTPATPPS